MYNLSRKPAYLKSEIVEIGPFWAISGLLLDSARFGRSAWEAGLNDYARGDGRSLNYARGDGRSLNYARGSGWVLIHTPEAVGVVYIYARGVSCF